MQRRVSAITFAAVASIALGAVLFWRLPIRQPTDNLLERADALEIGNGSQYKIIAFDDLECPACARINSQMLQEVASYHLHLIRYDIAVDGHTWSRRAEITALWFDRHSSGLGERYRNMLFADQSKIATTSDLYTFTTAFARRHHVSLPFLIDPGGHFAALLRGHFILARSLGVTVTPTFVVITHGKASGTRVIRMQSMASVINYLSRRHMIYQRTERDEKVGRQ